MPQTNEGILLVIGALFLLLGLLGGGFEVSAIKVPPIGNYTRAVTLLLGILLLGAGLYRLLATPAPVSPFIPTPTTIAFAATNTPIPPLPSPTVPPPTPTPEPSLTPFVPTPSPSPFLSPTVAIPTPVSVETSVPVTGQIQDVRVEYDVTRFERKGMVIHVQLHVTGLKNVASRVVAYFYLRTGAPLKDKNGTFTTTDGNVSASENFTPLDNDARFDDVQIFIPYDELELGAGSYQLKFFVSVFDMRHTEQALTSSLDINFDFNK